MLAIVADIYTVIFENMYVQFTHTHTVMSRHTQIYEAASECFKQLIAAQLNTSKQTCSTTVCDAVTLYERMCACVCMCACQLMASFMLNYNSMANGKR